MPDHHRGPCPRRRASGVNTPVVTSQDVARVFRAESGRCVATLVRVLGDIDRAEDAVQDAFSIALDRWPVDGLPDVPGAWIVTTARNRAIDGLRRSSRGRELQQLALADHRDVAQPGGAMPDLHPIPDDELRLVFTCCHPALSMQARVALTLRLFGGLSTAEVAAAFITSEDAMSARLTRAKARIRDAILPDRIPDASELPQRLDAALSVIHLIHTTGVDRPTGDDHGDVLVHEARRLARELRRLLPDEPEVRGLLALLLLSGARRATRHATDGSLVLLGDQDRCRWDREAIAEGCALLADAPRSAPPGPYELHAAIQALHTAPARAEDVDWKRVLRSYDNLLALDPSPVVRLNRAVAVAEVHGPAIALTSIEDLQLHDYAPAAAVRGDLLVRLDRAAEAEIEFTRGARLTTDPGVAAHLLARAGAALTSVRRLAASTRVSPISAQTNSSPP
jgi:RNA polymerase sigma-70 factor, ECF subfamily